MIQVQTPQEWRRRAKAMQAALRTIDELLRSAPAIPLEAGRRYRVVMYGQPVVEASWPPPVAHARQNSEAATRQELVGTLQQWFQYSEGGPRNAALLLERPAPGKLAIFAETDVLEYEALDG